MPAYTDGAGKAADERERGKGKPGVAAAVFLIALAYFLQGTRLLQSMAQKSKAAIASVSSERANPNDAAPFAWDAVYAFPPYAGRSEIEETIGFKSNSIRETASEGTVRLLFAKGKRTACRVKRSPAGRSRTLERRRSLILRTRPPAAAADGRLFCFSR